jgi:hypothetical protein
MHDEPSCHVRKTKIIEEEFKKISVKIVKGFFNVSLKSTCPIFFFEFLIKWMISFKTIALSEVLLPRRKFLW